MSEGQIICLSLMGNLQGDTMTQKPVPPDQRPNLSRDDVKFILRDLQHLIAALERIENRLRFSLNEPANDDD